MRLEPSGRVGFKQQGKPPYLIGPLRLFFLGTGVPETRRSGLGGAIPYFRSTHESLKSLRNEPAAPHCTQVVRTAQYGCNCRGAGGNGGCGEFDIVEAGWHNPHALVCILFTFLGPLDVMICFRQSFQLTNTALGSRAQSRAHFITLLTLFLSLSFFTSTVIGVDYADMLFTTVYDFKGTGAPGHGKYFLRPSVRNN